ncbi:MAG: hypothetical protein P4N59_25730 [Negativicutes bacterium]|nr:hypothetical protein [Negativicutes bacterium]
MKTDKNTDPDKIPTARLKASKRFGKYHRDLVTALLTEPAYTVDEAEQILDAFMARPKEPESDPEAPADPAPVPDQE